MKRKRFSVEQIVAVLKQAEAGMPVAELIRHVGISEQTFYRWKKVYADWILLEFSIFRDAKLDRLKRYHRKKARAAWAATHTTR